MGAKKKAGGGPNYSRTDPEYMTAAGIMRRAKREGAKKKAAAAGGIKSSNVSAYASRVRETEAQARKLIGKPKKK